MPETAASSVEHTRDERVREQRRVAAGRPGVYLFKDAEGKVLYVGQGQVDQEAGGPGTSRKPGTRGAADMVAQIEEIEFVATQTEAEALLAEQNFIKRHRPRFNIRLRDDKSYPYIGISLDEEYPRIYFTRERHRRNRAYFGPFSSAKRVRETLDLLGKVFQYRTCEGKEPGRQSGSPCLDYFIKRCQAPCVGYVSKEEYRANVDTIIDFLSGRYRQIERELRAGDEARGGGSGVRGGRAAAQPPQGRALAARAPADSQRGGGHARRDRRGGGGDGRERPGLPGARRRAGRPPELLPRERRGARRVGGARGVRAPVLRQRAVDPAAGDRPARHGARRRTWPEALAERRGGAGGGAPRRARATSAGSSSWPSETRGSRWIRTGCAPSAAARAGSRRSTASSRRSACRRSRCGSSASTSRTWARRTRWPRWWCSRAARRRSPTTAASASAGRSRTTSRRWPRCSPGACRQFRAQKELSPHEKAFDASFAALPALIVIDGGKGQLSSGVGGARGAAREMGHGVVSLAKQLEEVFVPGRPAPLLLPHDSAPLQLLQRVRDEAHRFAIEHHRDPARSRDDAVGARRPARRRPRPQARCSSSTSARPERFLTASREELEAVPGLPGKVARDLHAHVHRVD